MGIKIKREVIDDATGKAIDESAATVFEVTIRVRPAMSIDGKVPEYSREEYRELYYAAGGKVFDDALAPAIKHAGEATEPPAVKSGGKAKAGTDPLTPAIRAWWGTLDEMGRFALGKLPELVSHGRIPSEVREAWDKLPEEIRKPFIDAA